MRSAFIQPVQDISPSIGVIGGSGLYEIEGLTSPQEIHVDTPFGKPSDSIVGGILEGRQLYFLPRHARGHRILPTEINHRANVWALRSLNVRWLLCITAVGSLQQQYAPGHIVLPDQFYDRTSQGAAHTFFGNGIVAHVSMADPISRDLRKILHDAALVTGCVVHDGGTYVNMDGPAFSTRAESRVHRHLGFDIIGMTNLAEIKLAREAEIAAATLAMVTDYDCWKEDEAAVTAGEVVQRVASNAAAAKKIIAATIPNIPAAPAWPEHQSLNAAIMTPRSHWPQETTRVLTPLLHRFL